MTFLKGLVVSAMLALVLLGAIAAGALISAVDEANTPVYCWSQEGSTEFTFTPTWQDQVHAQLRSNEGVDSSIFTRFHTIKVTARNAADDTWQDYWAWPYSVEQDSNVQCNRANPNTFHYNAALWSTSRWVWHCLGIVLGLLAAVALGATGLQVALVIVDYNDWSDWFKVLVCLLGIIWPLGMVAGGLWVACMALYLIVRGVLKAGRWAGEL